MRFKNKFNAKPTTVAGIRFDSRREAAFYQELLLRKKAGEIHGEIEIHPVYKIDVNGKHVCKVELDFVYKDTMERRHYVDVKGFYPPLSRLKHKLLFAVEGIRVEVVR